MTDITSIRPDTDQPAPGASDRRDRPGDGDRGFTLVEVAIALVVIALLVGTVLQAQGMVGNTRVQALISDVGAIRTAFSQFQERYGALPGDYAGAAGLRTGLASGNGDGVLAGTGPSDESAAVWQHLTAAQFLTNLKIPATGVLVPATPLGGQYQVFQDSTGTWLRIGNMATSDNSGPLLTVEQARRLDQELDDGLPATGGIMNKTPACQGEGINIYNLTSSATCLVQVLMP
ncbi:prepilin-type N-terminal cleavage/methylation domain-containing protein [Tistrella bauzanensis]|jgi:prepilin-type N-terminal cleavage/methylation domain-containing protein|uniref:Prepilin-type N-terminal cleavage/methylation domain-containing protein n=1 Tax=Tistrella arctica TaxID=3133430 RepID=A0ABU9YHG8_9PROT